MDLSKFKTSDWLKVGGGIVFLIAGFLDWWEFDIAGFTEGFSGFDYFFTGIIPWLLLVAIGVLTALSALGVFKLPASLPAPLIFLAASAFSLLLVVIRLIAGPGHGAPDNHGMERGIGLWLALLAGAAVVAGCAMGFKESGGDISDLTDMNKLKNSFGGAGGGSTPPPPPPPPGMTPPPPPPPPPAG